MRRQAGVDMATRMGVDEPRCRRCPSLVLGTGGGVGARHGQRPTRRSGQPGMHVDPVVVARGRRRRRSGARTTPRTTAHAGARPQQQADQVSYGLQRRDRRRHRHRGPDRPAGGGQDRHHRGPPRRLVRRLHLPSSPPRCGMGSPTTATDGQRHGGKVVFGGTYPAPIWRQVHGARPPEGLESCPYRPARRTCPDGWATSPARTGSTVRSASTTTTDPKGSTTTSSTTPALDQPPRSSRRPRPPPTRPRPPPTKPPLATLTRAQLGGSAGRAARPTSWG